MKFVEWFKHDNNARHDPKILLMVQKKGPITKAVFWDLVEMLHEAGGKMKVCDAVSMAVYENHLSDDSIPNYILYESGLFVTDEEGYCYSERLQREIQHMQKVREAKSRGGVASGESRRQRVGTESSSGDEQKPNICSTNDEQHLKNKENVSSLHSDTKEKEDTNMLSSPSQNELALLTFDKEPLLTPDEFKDMWNSGCGKCTKAAKLTEQRSEKAKLRLAEFGRTRKEQIDTILQIMQNIRESDFLQNKWGGCSFIWIISNSDNWVKVYEGQYRNKMEQKKEEQSMIDKLKDEFDYIDNYFGNGKQQDSGIDEQ